MSIGAEYFRYLEHLGDTVTLRDLHEEPRRPDVVALRHDVDHDLDLALEMAHHERARGARATYFLLHTNPYWGDERFAIKCRQLAAYGHEVGLHLNVLTEWFQGTCHDPDRRLAELLAALRSCSVEVAGTSAHGDRACYEGGFINYWVFAELRGHRPEIDEDGRSAEGIAVDDERFRIRYPPEHRITRPGGPTVALWQSSLERHGLRYEAAHVACDRYWTDSGGSWQRSGDPLQADLSRGRHQVLVHPEWWRGPKKTYLVLSAARSGSKWLAGFVDRATSCRAVHELTLNHRLEGERLVEDKRTTDDFAGLIEHPVVASELIAQAAEHFGRLPGDVLEVNVYLEPFIERWKDLVPGGVLVHLHRDGRDVVRSILARGWYETPSDRRHAVIPVDEWDSSSQLERACWYWRYTQERIATFTQARIAFERMVTDRRYLEETLEALGIVVHPLLAAEEFPKRIDPSDYRGFPAFDAWSPDDRASFELICGEVQSALGYPGPSASGRQAPGRLAPRPGRGRDPGEATTVLSLDFGRAPAAAARGFGKAGVTAEPVPGGLLVRTREPADRTPHLVLARGDWARLGARAGVSCAESVYYVCRVRADLSPDMRARLFALFYDKAGALVHKLHATTLRPGAPLAVCSFRPPPGAHHLALALHLGARPPVAALLLRHVEVQCCTLTRGYAWRRVADVPAP